jgi:adenosylcobyric acid synthase
VPVRGYEIRHGEVLATGPATEAIPGGRGFVAGAVLGLTLHGVLESPEVVAALVGLRPTRSLDSVFDGLADLVEEHLNIGALARLAGVA